MTAQKLTTLGLIQAAFPGKIYLNSEEVALAGNLTPGSIRTLRCRGEFDLESLPRNGSGKCRFDIRDVADWLDARRAPGKKKRGAKTKVERLSAFVKLTQPVGGAI